MKLQLIYCQNILRQAVFHLSTIEKSHINVCEGNHFALIDDDDNNVYHIYDDNPIDWIVREEALFVLDHKSYSLIVTRDKIKYDINALVSALRTKQGSFFNEVPNDDFVSNDFGLDSEMPMALRAEELIKQTNAVISIFKTDGYYRETISYLENILKILTDTPSCIETKEAYTNFLVNSFSQQLDNKKLPSAAKALIYKKYQNIFDKQAWCADVSKLTLGFLNVVQYEARTFDDAPDVFEMQNQGRVI